LCYPKPKAIVQKMEEDNRANSILANEKFPKEIEAYKLKLKDCEEVASRSVMTQSELNEIKKRVSTVYGQVICDLIYI
jgi:hypothetical protein